MDEILTHYDGSEIRFFVWNVVKPTGQIKAQRNENCNVQTVLLASRVCYKVVYDLINRVNQIEWAVKNAKNFAQVQTTNRF